MKSFKQGQRVEVKLGYRKIDRWYSGTYSSWYGTYHYAVLDINSCIAGVMCRNIRKTAAQRGRK